MKEEKEKLEKYLIIFYFTDFLFKKYHFIPENKIKYKIEYKDDNHQKLIEDEKNLKEIEGKIEDESLDIDLIFEVLNMIKVCSELNGDLYCETKAFKYNYLVFDFYHSYLKD